MNGVLYFSGFTDADGGGLYKFDASNNDGITLVKDLTAEPEFDIIDGKEFKATNNNIYFKVTQFRSSDQLWVSNGTEAGTQMIKAFDIGETTFNYYGINGKLFFSESDPVNGQEPWVSDGTPDRHNPFKGYFPRHGLTHLLLPQFLYIL